MHCRLVLAPVLTALVALPAGAQQQQTRALRPATASTAVAVRAAPRAPTLDGRLDDAVWQTAPPISDFTQRDPHEGQPGSERTEVRVVYTDGAIYFGVRAWDSRPEAISAKLTRRDESSPSDWIGVAIDSYRDRRTAFFFLVNPAGVKRDVYLYDDNNQDDSWDAVWDVAVSRDSAGWTAEFEIPWSQLRFAKADRQTFGLNVYRKINRLNEEQYWRLLPKNESGVVSRFGDLTGIEGIRPPRRVEAIPYVVARQNVSPEIPGNPFATGSERGAAFGADFNVGVTSNLSLNATINPDFGQVEADPAVVNLSAFETFFPEKRPFFLEGLDVFQFGGGGGGGEQLFYTRRVGRSPQGFADPRGGYVEPLNQTTILGAAKLTGKTSSGWTMGLLGAQTAAERVGVIDSAGVLHQDLVEPASTYFVGRLARDFRNGQSRVGFIGTGVGRYLPDDGRLDFLRSSAFTGGVDWEHRFRNDTYGFRGWMAGSRIHGSPDAMLRAQRSSARYYQRPDADYLTLDSTRTSLEGVAGAASFGKHGGGNWRFSAGVDTRSPGFELNDLGFQNSADWHGQWLWVQRRWNTPGKVFRRFFVNLNQWQTWNYGWDRTELGGNVNMNWTFTNYWGGFAGINVNDGGLGTRALRGGPGIIRPPSWNGWAGFNSDSRKDLRVSAGGWYFRQQAEETKSGGVWANVSVRPAANMDFTISPSVNWTRDDWQYLTQRDALGERRYIFGDLSQTTVSTTFRGNVTFTPTLSVQLYAEPFVSAGQYVEFKQVADPRADDYADRFDTFGSDRLIVNGGDVSIDLDRDGAADIGLGNPDFQFLSFRSNVVLRWEYKLGSTLFVVWQHGRTGFSNDGRFALGSGLRDLFATEADNTFLVKLNYWISL